LVVALLSVLALNVTSAAADAFTIANGAQPSVAVDQEGTAHVVWNQVTSSTQADILHYCQVPRGATSCQHEQTFDAVALQWQPLSALTVSYDWLDRVHRVAGRDALNPLVRERKLNTHLFNAAWTHGTQHWSGYAYLREDRDVASASTATYGLRWSGKALRDGNGLGWTVEGARQYDYANNPLHFAHSYWLLEPGWTQAGVTAKLGWEHLGGNGRHALQTPLATLHAFNGWNDQFNVIPAGGLEDRYAGVNGNFGRVGVASKLAWSVVWHDYRADRGGRYGSEWDASLAFPLATGLSGLVKLGNYQGDGFGRDSAKLWLQLEWRGQHGLTSAR
jgi:hypothetical protein